MRTFLPYLMAAGVSLSAPAYAQGITRSVQSLIEITFVMDPPPLPLDPPSFTYNMITYPEVARAHAYQNEYQHDLARALTTLGKQLQNNAPVQALGVQGDYHPLKGWVTPRYTYNIQDISNRLAIPGLTIELREGILYLESERTGVLGARRLEVVVGDGVLVFEALERQNDIIPGYFYLRKKQQNAPPKTREKKKKTKPHKKTKTVDFV